jgi:hypothetical protein
LRHHDQKRNDVIFGVEEEKYSKGEGAEEEGINHDKENLGVLIRVEGEENGGQQGACKDVGEERGSKICDGGNNWRGVKLKGCASKEEIEFQEKSEATSNHCRYEGEGHPQLGFPEIFVAGEILGLVIDQALHLFVDRFISVKAVHRRLDGATKEAFLGFRLAQEMKDRAGITETIIEVDRAREHE